MVGGYEGLQRIKIEDGSVALVKCVAGAQGTLPISYIAVGSYPGVVLGEGRMRAFHDVLLSYGCVTRLQRHRRDALRQPAT